MTGELVLEGVVGSTAHGLTITGSDRDYLGVFVAPTRDVLGLSGSTAVEHSVVSHDPDRTHHELGKFCRLCLAGNPTVMELLWLEEYTAAKDRGVWLVAERRAFLSTAAVRNAYGGYAVQQARKLVTRTQEGKAGFGSDLAKRTEKHGRHCYRLLLAGTILLETGELVVNVSNHRDRIFSMGELARTDPGGFAQRFQTDLENMDLAAARSCLPDEPDRELINRLLVEARLTGV